MRKVICALSPSWEVKFTTLKELNDKEEMKLIGLIGNLKTREMKRKAKEEKAPQKKKTLAFKSTPTIFDDEDDDQDDDEDLSLLVKNVQQSQIQQPKKMASEEGKENSLTQLPEARTCHC